MVQGYPRHVTFDWSMYNPPSYTVRSPNLKQSQEVKRLFPDAHSIFFTCPFTEVAVDTLPPEPWPVTVAGVPLYLSTATRQPFGHYGSGSRVAKELRLGDLQPDEARRKAQDWAASEGFNALEIEFVPIGPLLYVTMRDNLDTSWLPSRIGDVMVQYRVDGKERPVSAEQRERDQHEMRLIWDVFNKRP